MALPLKPVVVLGCLTGTVCSVAIPVSLNSQKGIQTNLIEGGGYQSVIGSPNEQEEDEENFEMSFDELWKKIDKHSFTWKEKLNAALQSSSNIKWMIEAEDYESLEKMQNESEVFCIYLELKSSQQQRYKLRVSKFGGKQWAVTIVKPKQTTIEYWDENTSLWKEKSGVNFEKLTTFKNSQQGNWEDVKAVSFTA